MHEVHRVPSRSRRDQPISARQVVEIALGIVQTEGFDALTMRRVAGVLDTGAASLYVHVKSKAALDDLMLGALSVRVTIPEADPLCWRAQITDVCVQLRDQYLQYPGIARAAMSVVPTDLETLRINEGMLGILLAGGLEPRTAAWAIDALALYVAAYAFERYLAARRGAGELDWMTGPDAVASYLSSLPSTDFPLLRQHAGDLTGGSEHDRFDFALNLLLDGLKAKR